MRRKLTFKPSLADTKRANNAAMDFYEHLSGKPTPEGGKAVVAEKRTLGPRKPTTDGDGSEASNLREIIAFLCSHHKVALVERHNSGAATSAGGAYVEFHHLYTWGINGEKMRKPDICGQLINGKYFAIEVKKRGWTKPTDQREQEQLNYLVHVRWFGGLSTFATCVADVEKML